MTEIDTSADLDIVWRQDEKRLVVGLNRLDWEQTLAGATSSRRLISALRFDSAVSVVTE